MRNACFFSVDFDGVCIQDETSDLIDFGEHDTPSSRISRIEHIDPAALPKKRAYEVAKRVFDMVASALALIVLAVPMMFIALAVKLDSPGPVLYRQERLGLNGKPFTLVKFRSMGRDAEADGAQWAQENDPRVTKVGRILRSTRLDEFPQFWNVLIGDMSLVGPRPERAVFYEQFETYIPGFSQRMLVKPGLSGLAQVMGGYDLLPEEKIVYDIEYIKNRSVLMDVSIIGKTFVIVLSREGAR